MPVLNVKIGPKEFDLYQISNATTYNQLDALPKKDRQNAAQYLAGFMHPEELRKVISHLAKQCFTVRGAAFVSEGAESFLGDILKAYVNKYDGPTMVQAYLEQRLDRYKFSEQSILLFNRLAEIAKEESIKQNDAHLRDNLPINISNKVWQPIIMDWLMQDVRPQNTTPEQQLKNTNVTKALQAVATNTELLTSIFYNNLKAVDAAACSEDLRLILRTPGEAIVDFNHTLASIEDDETLQKSQALIKKIQELGQQQTIPMDELAAIIDETNKLLTKQISLEAYQEKCKLLEGAGKKVYTNLSILMLAVAAAAVVAGIVVAATGAVPTLVAGVGTHIAKVSALGASMKLMKAGQTKGLAKAAEDVAEAHQKARQPEDDKPADDFIPPADGPKN
jgi:hypothetical protein